jgi:hypothetical protein
MLDCSLHELFDDVITPDCVLAKKNRILIVLLDYLSKYFLDLPSRVSRESTLLPSSITFVSAHVMMAIDWSGLAQVLVVAEPD